MAARTTRRGPPDSAARLRALTRRAYTATAGHLDLDDDAGREFDRIVSGEDVRRGGVAGTSGAAGPARRDAAGARDGSGRRSRAGDGSTVRTGSGTSATRRWAVSGRAAVVLLAVVAALAGAVVARAIALGPSDPVPVPQLTVHESGPVAGEGTAADEAGAREAWTPSAVPDPPDAGEAVAGGAAGGSAAATGSSVVVHVAGAVLEPGVVELPAGARVAQAIDSAGGAHAEAELAAVNLARPLQDGEQVYVPRVGEAPPGTAAGPAAPADPAGSGSGGGVGPEGVVDLNTADLSALDTLPGVGPAIAQRILDWREANGPFHSVDELLEVSGIGPATLERVRERVRV